MDMKTIFDFIKTASLEEVALIETSCFDRREAFATELQRQHAANHKDLYRDTMRNLELKHAQREEMVRRAQPASTERFVPPSQEIRDKARKFADENLNVGRRI
jgi:hypothetical protein